MSSVIFGGQGSEYWGGGGGGARGEVGCWLVVFGFNGPLRQYFSLYRAVSQREGEREEKRIDESKNIQTTPTRTYYKRSRPLTYCNPNCRTPRHWKFTQHHRTTRPPPTRGEGGKLFAGYKLIGAPPPPPSVPNDYISHIEN